MHRFAIVLLPPDRSQETHSVRPPPQPQPARRTASSGEPTGGLFAPLTVALAAAVLLGATACAPQEPAAEPADPPPPAKVLLVGVDGATFSVIDPMVAEGELPHLARLMEGGSRGPLRAGGALVSPPIWTTVATGVPPREHGVRGFFYRSDDGEQVLVDSSLRQAGALWNWMGPLERRVGFAGWWASWPAERVNGWILSDRFARSQWSAWPGGVRREGVTWPPELSRELAPLVFDPKDPPMEELASLAHFTDGELQRLEELAEPVPYDGLSDLKFGYLAQRSYEEATLRLLEAGGQPDLTGVFLIAIDPVSHRFWHLHEPAAFEGVEPQEVERLGMLIPNLYRHVDHFLGRLLASVDEDTLVLVISDHGFEASGELETSGDHHREGILIAAGGPVVAGVHTEARMVDVAPTVLRAMGLPVPDDLPGRVLEELFDPAYLAAHDESVATFEPLYRREERPDAPSPGDPAMTELLRSLGYLD